MWPEFKVDLFGFWIRNGRIHSPRITSFQETLDRPLKSFKKPSGSSVFQRRKVPLLNPQAGADKLPHGYFNPPVQIMPPHKFLLLFSFPLNRSHGYCLDSESRRCPLEKPTSRDKACPFQIIELLFNLQTPSQTRSPVVSSPI